MNALVGVIGLVLICVVLWDAFETIVLPRRVSRKLRLARYFYRLTWRSWSAIWRTAANVRRREAALAMYGPLSLLLLLTTWAIALVFSFGLLQWAASSTFYPMDDGHGFRTQLYLSGTTFFTLGIGDITPDTTIARILTVVESGVGFGFIAIVIGYLPVVYQAFSRREVNISLLDARAGSPPTAGELLRRHASDCGVDALQQLLRDWEHWSAELMESHLSYPVLAYFRSQHNNQSWLSALTAILDTSAFLMTGAEGPCARQAELTFAIARHAVVDLSQVFGTPPKQASNERLAPAQFAELRSLLSTTGIRLRGEDRSRKALEEIRRSYEPFVQSLSHYLLMDLPPWLRESGRKDNWQTSAWQVSMNITLYTQTHSADDDHDT